MLEDVIVGLYHKWAIRKIPRDAIANRYMIFDFFSPYPLTNVSYRVYSNSRETFFDYFVQETFPRRYMIDGTIRLDQSTESAIFKSAMEVCTDEGRVVLCSQWSERDSIKARCFIVDRSCDYSYRLVVNGLRHSLEVNETIFAIRRVFNQLLSNENETYHKIKRISQ